VDELSGVPVLGSVEVDGAHCDGVGGVSVGTVAGGGVSPAIGGGDGGGLVLRAVFLLGFVFFFFIIRFAFFFAPFLGLRFLGKQITRPIVEVSPVINLHRSPLGIPQFRVNACVGYCSVSSHAPVSDVLPRFNCSTRFER
jgi:hypothetical protein